MSNKTVQQSDLTRAAEAGDESRVCYRLDQGLSVDGTDSDGRTALPRAASRGNAHIVRLLVESGANMSTDHARSGETALLGAARRNKTASVRELIRLGASVDEKNSSGETALYTAAKAGKIDCIGVLVELGASMSEKNASGETPLFTAARMNNIESVRELIRLGASMNEKNEREETVLAEAARAGHMDLFRALVDLGADLNKAKSKDETALSAPVRAGYTIVVTPPNNLNPSISETNRRYESLSDTENHALKSFVVVKLGRFLPNVLNTLLDYCSFMFETEVMSRRVANRIRHIYQQLQGVDATEQAIALDQYSEVVVRFYQFQVKHREQEFATRLILCLQVAEDVSDFHEKIDQLNNQLKSFGEICANEAAIAAHTKTDRAKLDALTLLRNVISWRGISRGNKVNYHWQMVDNLGKLLAKFSAEPQNVIAAEWFVPPYMVDCDEASLTQGPFGAVYHGKMNGADVIVKKVLVADDGAREQLLKEVQIWCQLRRPHVLSFLGACHIGDFSFVCENATNGTLPDFLKKGDNRMMAWEKLHEVALELKCLHDKKIIHGDLKDNNLLVGADGKAKVADFGLSLIVANSRTMKPVEVGAPHRRAPEILKEESISFASDISALGMCIAETVSGEYPWGNSLVDAAVCRNVKMGTALARPGGFNGA